MRKAIGFWFSDNEFGDGCDNERLPDPHKLVDNESPVDSQRVAQICQYLDSGPNAFGYDELGYLGYSWCRFGCDLDNGSQDLTDGTWVWPEGLSHYVSFHNVRLPDDFVEHMQRNRWRIPKDIVFGNNDYSFDYWYEWGAFAVPGPDDEIFREWAKFKTAGKR